MSIPPILYFVVVTLAGLLNRSQQDALTYLREGNRVLRAQLVYGDYA